MHEKLRDKEWSYSALSLYNDCPASFKAHYIDELPKKSNAFAEYGGFVHNILNRFFRGELEDFELASIYRKHYAENVVSEFPFLGKTNLSEMYYMQGHEYLLNFKGFDGYEAVGSEIEFHTTIAGKRFIGFIDLLLKDAEGNYIIVDHKSKNKFKSKKERSEYLRQLYLYSVWVKEEYGKYPTELWFNMFRGKIDKNKFVEDNLKKALIWAEFTLDMIDFDATWQKSGDYFYCRNLCDVRDYCEEVQE